jgi:hypothetical protein
MEERELKESKEVMRRMREEEREGGAKRKANAKGVGAHKQIG